MVRRPGKSRHRRLVHRRFFVFLEELERRNADTHHGYADAGQGNGPRSVDLQHLPVGRNEIAERNKASHTRDQCQDHQRNGHHRRGFMGRMMRQIGRSAPEDTEVQTEHVERRQTGREIHPSKHPRAEHVGSHQDFVLGEKAREWRNSRNGQARYHKRDVRNGHMLAQTTHLRHLVGMHRMDHRTGSQEEQRLEHGVGKQMPHTGRITQGIVPVHAGYAQSDDHKADLGNGREGQHPFDIRLEAGDHRRKERSEGTHVSDVRQHLRCSHDVQREHARYQEHTGYHHRCGMDQGRNRRRAFHRVGQPDVQGEHCRLTGTADKDQAQPPGCRRNTQEAGSGCRRKRRAARSGQVDEVERLGIEGQYQNTQQEAQVGKAGNDKGFLRSGNGRRTGVVKPDEQIRGYAHQFPEDVHLENVGSHHQPEHREGEQREEGVVTRKTPLALHVTQAVDVHHQRHGGDHHQHHARDGIQQYAQVDVQVFGKTKPHPVVLGDLLVNAVGAFSIYEEVIKCGPIRQYCGNGQSRRTDQSGRASLELSLEESQKQEHHHGNEQNVYRVFHFLDAVLD